MLIQTAEQSPAQLYHLMIQTIVPRPIAWVTSKNPNGTMNLAPFSFFNGVCSSPPLVMLSIGHKTSGEQKDTWVNILREKQFVINLPSAEDAQAVTDSAYEFPHNESEVDSLSLEQESAFSGCELPLLKSVKAAFLCSLYKSQQIGDNNQGLVFGKLEQIYLSEDIASTVRSRVLVDADKWSPLARLGGIQYASLDKVFEVPRAKEKPGSP